MIPIMTVNQWKTHAQTLLKDATLTYLLDTDILLSYVLQVDKSWIAAHGDTELSQNNLKKLNSLLAKRANSVPIAYLLGEKEFYGRNFRVNKHVLIPRPESEAIIDEFLALALPEKPLIADIGSGSGVLGITAVLEKPGTRLTMIDIDPLTFLVAKRNARTYGVKAQYYQGNLFDAWRDDYDVIFCNLPYVPTNYKINIEASHEPTVALFGGDDGLDLFRELFTQLKAYHKKPVVITESLPLQHETLTQIALTAGYYCSKENELIQVFR